MVAILSPNEVLVHAPVLIEETVQHLAVQAGGRYVDCTVGAGGHSRAIMEAASPGGLLLGLDADPEALAIAAETLEPFGDAVRLVESNFRSLGRVCSQSNFTPVHGVLFDLGMSSMQLAGERGFSFQTEAPLDMRFSPGQALTAEEIVNRYGESDLADVLWRYGEEPGSRRIARAIVRARPIHNTVQLASVVARTLARPRTRIHPATRTFQALRIAVNDELGALEDGLTQARDVLGQGGRLVVISFHSLEDRIVKQFLQRESRDCICSPEQPACTCGHHASMRLIVKRSITAGAEELAANPRSRSARLRVAEKLPERK